MNHMKRGVRECGCREEEKVKGDAEKREKGDAESQGKERMTER